MAWQLPQASSPLRRLPGPIKRLLNKLYWIKYDLTDFLAEAVGCLPSHALRLVLYRHVLHVRVGTGSSIHRGCRFYWPTGVHIGEHTVINRNVLLDGRGLLDIGDNVSISEGTEIFTLEHDPNSPDFQTRAAPVLIRDRVFIGARALVLPGVTLGQGAYIGAGSIVTRDLPDYTIAAGVPARPIGHRAQDLTYILTYRKFLG